MIIMNAFIESKCEICGKNFLSPHRPGYKICYECAEENNLCLQCGKKLGESDE